MLDTEARPENPTRIPEPTDSGLWSVAPLVSPAELEAIADEWNALAQNVPFRSYEWAASWWQHYRTAGMRLFVPAVRNASGRLVGVAPWCLNRSAGWGRAIQFLGSGDVCSEYLSLVCQAGDAPRVGRVLAQWLAEQARHEWDVLDLPAIDQADTAIGQLGQQLSARGHAVDCQADARCWRVGLPASWNEYLAGFSKSRRDRIRYLLRRHVESGQVVLRRADDRAQLDQAFDTFVDLHQRRREMLGQPGCFASAAFGAMHREVSRQFFDSGRLRLIWLEIDGRPLAVEYSFVGGSTVYYYQGGFEPQMAELCPGTLMLAASLRLAIEEGYREFDFLRGDEPYKATWNAEAVPLANWRIAGRSASARVRRSAWRTRETVKRWIRTRMPAGVVPATPPRSPESN